MPFQTIRMNIKFALLFIMGLVLNACSTQTVKTVEQELLGLPEIQLTLQQCASVVAVGDVMLGGSALPVMKENGYDYAFNPTREELTKADVAIANLETALTHRGKPFDKKYTFRNPPEKMVPALKNAGFDLVSLANNHTVDYGIVGLKDTLNALQKGALPSVGAGMNVKQARAVHIIEVNGQKLGFLGYSLTYPEEFWATSRRPGTAFGHASHIKRDVIEAKKQVDHVIVQFHWGREGTTDLRYYQPQLARMAIDSGASLIIGHHPHVLQGMERYKNGLIYYSLGNFAFGSYSRRSKIGGMAKVSLCPSGIQEYGLGVLDVYNFRVKFSPQWVKPNVLKKTLKHMQSLSKTMKLSIKPLDNSESSVPAKQKASFLHGKDKP